MVESILRILEDEGQRSAAEIAERLGGDEAAVAAQIEELENNHVILGYRTLIDWEKTDWKRIYAFI